MLEEVLGKLSDEGKTMLISTHDVDFAYRWAERAVVFCGGEIIADDTPLRVFQNEEVLKKANLKRPMMLDVYETLTKNNILEKEEKYPYSVEEFVQLIEKVNKNRA
jgi:cobalt/nickel transport system ATP-binding protein